ncbi:hypothetical protein [Salinisphaera sp. C84B14]|uniref:hypothetical protein n=1 Tax=Salinisphaera sp. C84B14 TaxID=1304155 RepID=UPI003342A233
MNLFKATACMAIVVGLPCSSIVLADDTNAEHNSNPDVSNDTVAGWIEQYYGQMDFNTRGGQSLIWKAPGLDSEDGATCRQRVTGVSSSKRREIQHSADYQRVSTSCYRFSPGTMKSAMEMGLVDQNKPSPFVFNFKLTDRGREHVESLGNGRFQIPVAAESLENVLSAKASTNRYGVAVVDVTFTTIPKALNWAAPYVGRDKAVSIGNPSSSKHVAQFWKTDKGWEAAYVFDG